MANKLNVRSPYIITDNTSNLLFTQLDLKVYSGTSDASVSSPTYTLNGTAINGTVTFDISELVKDYITNNFDGTYDTNNVVWVNYRLISTTTSTSIVGSVVTLRAFFGWDYYNELNINANIPLLQSNKDVYKLDDNAFNIAIDTQEVTSVTYVDAEDNQTTISVSSSNENDEQIQYISDSVDGLDNYSDRVLADDGILETSNCLQTFLDDYSLFNAVKIYIETTNGIELVNINNVQECQYQPYKLTFINKFGAYQDIWFFKNSKKTLTTTKEDYKSNSSAIYEAQYKTFNKVGKQKLTINSGFYPEDFNEVFTQLLLSELVWIEIDNQTLPINISNSSFNYKTQLNDKLINYTLDIDFAFDLINNVR